MTRGDDTSKTTWFCGVGQICEETKRDRKQANRYSILLHQRTDQFMRLEHDSLKKISMYFEHQVARETPVFAICIPRGGIVKKIAGWKSVISFFKN